MKKETIFVHIPKTGGTTINTIMHNSYWQTKPDFFYRHIDGKSFVSNAGDIFNPLSLKRYNKFNIITMLRDPVDRILSEYFFMKDRKGLMDLFKDKPKSIDEYISNPQTANGVLKFLIGERMYSDKRMTKTHLEDVLYAIENLPVHVGIFEQYGRSVEYFQAITGVKWPKKIEKKRVTFKRMYANELSNETIEKIKHNNELDALLYNECLKFFEKNAADYTGRNRSFKGDEYDHVVPYCYNWPFFEFWLEDKKFIEVNMPYFKALTDFLLKEKGIRDGRKFTIAWNKTFVANFSDQFPNHQLNQDFQTLVKSNAAPLEMTEEICRLIDESSNSKNNRNLYEPLNFNNAKVIYEKDNFFNRFISPIIK